MSEWKVRSNKRRDVRATKTPDTEVPHKSSKNTKKWCKGKVGVEHKLKCFNYEEIKHTSLHFEKDWKVLACTVCGKELDHYYPMLQWRSPRPKPDWVV